MISDGAEIMLCLVFCFLCLAVTDKNALSKRNTKHEIRNTLPR